MNSQFFSIYRISAESSQDNNRIGSAGKLSSISASLSPNSPTTNGSSKLTRKFSLSPKVIRKKIIARLQQEAERTGSSESETEDLLTVSRLKNYKVSCRRILYEIC